MRKCGTMRIFVLLLLLSLALPAAWPIGAEGRHGETSSQRRVVIFEIPRFLLEEISPRYPALYHFVSQGAAGVLTTVLPDPVTPEKMYLAFNSGASLKTPGADSGLFFDVAEEYQGMPAGDLYRSLTGHKPFPARAVYLGLAKLFQINEAKSWAIIGQMGNLLQRHGFQTAVIGNADADVVDRSAALMLMDDKGRITYGAVGQETLQADHQFPFGFRSNLAKLWEKWRQVKDKAGVVLISLGDLERLERYRNYLSEERYASFRRRVLADYDRFLAKLLPEINPAVTLTALFTAMPPRPLEKRGDANNTRLNPLVLSGPGFQQGLLFSDATRRPGIVTVSDLAVTIFHFLGIDDYEYWSGRPLRTTPGGWAQTQYLERQLAVNYNCRWILLPVYGYLLIAILLILILVMIFWPDLAFLYRALVYGYLFLLTFPAVFLVEGVLNPLSWEWIIGITLGLAALFFGAVFRLARGNPLRMLSGIGLVTFIFILLDGLTNGYAEIFSFLGYAAVSGARFYGIGNEYLGFLLGAYIVFVSFNWERLQKCPRLLWLAAYLLALLLAHPQLGANIGGGITAILGLGITNYLWLERPVRWREGVRLTLSLITLLLVVGLWDLFISGPTMTHFGKFIGIMEEHGFPAFIRMYNHKLNLNWQLIGSTPWAKILLFFFLGALFFFHRSPKPVTRLLQRYPAAMRGFLGLTITAIIGLLVNDSGIVTVTTLSVFGLFQLFVVILKEWGFLKKV